MDKILHRILFNAASRKDLLDRMERQTKAMLIVGGLALVVLLIGLITQTWSASLVILLGIGAIAAFLWFGRESPDDFDPTPIAKTIEREHPDLQAMLVTAVEQHPEPDGQMNYLQHRVIELTLEEARRQQWVNFVDESEIQGAKFKRMLWTLGAWIAVVVLGFFGFKGAFGNTPAILPPINLDIPALEKSAFEVTPGDTRIEKGSRLPVSIKFNMAVPTEVDLFIGPNQSN